MKCKFLHPAVKAPRIRTKIYSEKSDKLSMSPNLMRKSFESSKNSFFSEVSSGNVECSVNIPAEKNSDKSKTFRSKSQSYQKNGRFLYESYLCSQCRQPCQVLFAISSKKFRLKSKNDRKSTKKLQYWFSLKMILRPIKYAKMTFSAESFSGQVNFSFDNPAEKLSPIEKKWRNCPKNVLLSPKLMEKTTKTSEISFSLERLLCTHRMRCRQLCQKVFQTIPKLCARSPNTIKKIGGFSIWKLFLLSVSTTRQTFCNNFEKSLLEVLKR